MSPERRSGPSLGTGTAPEISSAGNVAEATVARNGIDQAIENASNDWWYSGALVFIKQIAQTGHGFTADDLLSAVGEPPASEYVGAVFASAQRSKIIEPLGCRVASDNRMVRIWWAVGR